MYNCCRPVLPTSPHEVKGAGEMERRTATLAGLARLGRQQTDESRSLPRCWRKLLGGPKNWSARPVEC